MKVALAIASALSLALTACAAPEPASSGQTEVERDARNAALTGRVKSALAADVGLKTITSINVDSAGSVVTLKGKVDTQDQRQRAEQVAAAVDGVSRVNNQLTVGP